MDNSINRVREILLEALETVNTRLKERPEETAYMAHAMTEIAAELIEANRQEGMRKAPRP